MTQKNNSGAATVEAEQLPLIAQEKLATTLGVVFLGDIAPPVVLHKPDPALVESIKTYGMWEPMILRKTPAATGYLYEIVEGRKRYFAAMEAGLEPVPALVITSPEGTWNPHTVTLASHGMRRTNLRVEVQAIDDLRRQGRTEKEIARATGYSVAEIKQKLTILDLIPALLERYMGGEIADSVALSVAKLEKPTQEHIEQALLIGVVTKVTAQVVKQARSAYVQSTLARPEMELPAMPVPDAAFGDIYGDAEETLPLAVENPFRVDDGPSLMSPEEREAYLLADQTRALKSVQVTECANCGVIGLCYDDREAFVCTNYERCLNNSRNQGRVGSNGTDGASTAESATEALQAAVEHKAESQDILAQYERLRAAAAFSLRSARKVNGKTNKTGCLVILSSIIAALSDVVE